MAPDRDGSVITALARGEERLIVVMSGLPDANTVFAVHADDGTFQSLVKSPVDRDDGASGRSRHLADTASDIWELYWLVGSKLPFPYHWCDPELEPFFPFPAPRI